MCSLFERIPSIRFILKKKRAIPAALELKICVCGVVLHENEPIRPRSKEVLQVVCMYPLNLA